MEAEANPLPSDERTPPVTKMNFVGIAPPFQEQGLGQKMNENSCSEPYTLYTLDPRLEGVEQLLQVDGGRSDFPHHNASRMVGDDSRFPQRGARCQGQAKRSDDGISGAGNVVDLLRRGRDVSDPPILKERHTLLSSGHQHGARPELLLQRAPHLKQMPIITRGNTGEGGRLVMVRGHHRRALVQVQVMDLWINNNDLSLPSSKRENPLSDPFTDHSLRVVRDDHAIYHTKVFHHKREQPLRCVLREVHATLSVESDDLLTARHHPSLDRRGSRPVHHDPIALDPSGLELIHQSLPWRIVADDTHQDRRAAQRSNIRRNVPGATQSNALALHLHHWNRGLRRKTRNAPPDILVRHDVADDEKLLFSKPCHYLLVPDWRTSRQNSLEQ